MNLAEILVIAKSSVKILCTAPTEAPPTTTLFRLLLGPSLYATLTRGTEQWTEQNKV